MVPYTYKRAFQFLIPTVLLSRGIKYIVIYRVSKLRKAIYLSVLSKLCEIRAALINSQGWHLWSTGDKERIVKCKKNLVVNLFVEWSVLPKVEKTAIYRPRKCEGTCIRMQKVVYAFPVLKSLLNTLCKMDTYKKETQNNNKNSHK